MRVYSHSNGLVIFCPASSSRVLTRERWQTFEISWKKAQYLMNTLYKHSSLVSCNFRALAKPGTLLRKESIRTRKRWRRIPTYLQMSWMLTNYTVKAFSFAKRPLHYSHAMLCLPLILFSENQLFSEQLFLFACLYFFFRQKIENQHISWGRRQW